MQLGYLISSHISYAEPLARLLGSMAALPRSAIVAVVGGYPVAGWETYPHGVVTRHVPYRAFDYTALIDFAEYPADYPDWSHVFLLHDTMEVGSATDTLVRLANPDHKATAVWGGQCNLGLYRADYLRSCLAQLLPLKNCSKRYSVEMEGFLWKQLPESERGSYGGECVEGGTAIVYGGSARMAERYTAVDLTKYKANWGQNMEAMVVVP